MLLSLSSGGCKPLQSKQLRNHLVNLPFLNHLEVQDLTYSRGSSFSLRLDIILGHDKLTVYYTHLSIYLNFSAPLRLRTAYGNVSALPKSFAALE